MSAVTDIRFVGYALPDLDAERAFYRDKWGMAEVGERETASSTLPRRAATSRASVRLRAAADAKRVDVIELAAANRVDVAALHARVLAAGCRDRSSRRGNWRARRRVWLSLLLAGRPAIRHFVRRGAAGSARRSARWNPFRCASATSCCTRRTTRPWCGSSPKYWAFASATGSATSCVSCAATNGTTALRCCPGRRA